MARERVVGLPRKGGHSLRRCRTGEIVCPSSFIGLPARLAEFYPYRWSRLLRWRNLIRH